jgi:predicted secreted acid phosphatase
MKRVDFSNPYLRRLIPEWLIHVRATLQTYKENLPGWVEESQKAEEAAREGAPRKLAVVLDLDETIWCNLHKNTYEVAAVDGKPGVHFNVADELGWPRDTPHNPLLPGARALLEKIHKLDLAVFFLSGRLESQRKRTVANFQHLGLAGEGRMYSTDALSAVNGTLILCPEEEDPPEGESIYAFKTRERKRLEADYRIILNVGDQVSDLGDYGDRHYQICHQFYRTP